MSEPAFADDARLSYQIRTMLKLGNYPQLDMMQEWLAKAQEMEDALAVPEGLTEAGARAIDEACSAPEPAPPKALRYLIARKFGVEMEDVSTEQAQAIAAIIKACGGQVPGDHTSTVSFDTEKFKRAFERMRKEASTPEPEPWAEAERVLEAAVTSRKLRSWDVGQHGTYSEYTMLWPSDSGAYCHSLNHLSREAAAAEAVAFLATLPEPEQEPEPGEYTVTVSFDPDKVECPLARVCKDLCEGLAEAVVCTPEPTEH